MASRVISTILNLKDLFSPTLNEVTRNTREFQNQLQHTQNEVTKMKNNVSDSFGSIKTKVAGVIAGLGIGMIAKQSIELASDLNEVQNVVDVTFGKGASQIDSWTKTALNSFGLSELQAKQFTGTLGALMKSSGVSSSSLVTMSEKLTGLSGDFASFYNLDPSEAFEKIKSGISGETEPLKALGINMSVANLQAFALKEGITKQYSAMNQGEQTLLRYNYLMSVSKDAQGDFNRTSGSFANQLRIAKTSLEQTGASIGSYFLPYLTKLLQVVNSGGIQSLGTILQGVGNGIINILNSAKTPLEALVNSLGKLGIASGLQNMFKGIDGKPLETLKYSINSVIYGIRDLADFATKHITLIKFLFVSLGTGFTAVKIVQEGVKIKNTITDIKTAISGFNTLRQSGTLFSTLFKIPPTAVPFIAIIGVIAGLAFLIIKNWTPITNFFKTTFGNISTSLGNMGNGLQTTFLLIYVSVRSTFTNIYNWFGTTFNNIKTFFINLGTDIETIWNSLMTWFTTLPTRLWQIGVDMFTGLKNGMWSIISTIGDWIATSFNSFINFFKNLPSTLLQIGEDIVGQLKQGIMNEVDGAVQVAKDLGDKILKGIRSIFGISSPSKEMFSIGGYLIQGLENAIFKGKSTLQTVASTVFGGTMDFIQGIISGGDVSSWIMQALTLTGTDSSWLNGLLMLASRESGDPGKLGTGNASLVNNVGVGGEYATGLLQMLPSTFKEFFAGFGDIKNPVANVASAIKYIKSRYGSVYNIPNLFNGNYKGYLEGTKNATEGIHSLSEDGKPEIVVGKQNRLFRGGEQVFNAKDTSTLLGNKKYEININYVVQGNLIGNKEFMEESSEYTCNKIVFALNNM